MVERDICNCCLVLLPQINPVHTGLATCHVGPPPTKFKNCVRPCAGLLSPQACCLGNEVGPECPKASNGTGAEFV